jgi:hypothetical protein
METPTVPWTVTVTLTAEMVMTMPTMTMMATAIPHRA